MHEPASTPAADMTRSIPVQDDKPKANPARIARAITIALFSVTVVPVLRLVFGPTMATLAVCAGSEKDRDMGPFVLSVMSLLVLAVLYWIGFSSVLLPMLYFSQVLLPIGANVLIYGVIRPIQREFTKQYYRALKD